MTLPLSHLNFSLVQLSFSSEIFLFLSIFYVIFCNVLVHLAPKEEKPKSTTDTTTTADAVDEAVVAEKEILLD